MMFSCSYTPDTPTPSPLLSSPHTHTQPTNPRRRGPTSLEDVLDEGEYELQPLPSDEAWFGEPDPSIYAPGTNDLSKEQLAEELAKGNVCTLRQLKQHLLTASESELEVSESVWWAGGWIQRDHARLVDA